MFLKLTLWGYGLQSPLNTFKYQVSCTDGKILVKINLLFYLFFIGRTIQHLCFILVGFFFIVNTTFSTGLMGETSTPTRPVESVVLTTKGLQDRNNNC